MRVHKHLILVVILFLAGALVYTSYLGFEAFAEPKDPNWGENCTFDDIALNVTCCWTEPDLYNPGTTVTWCQTCDGDGTSCGPLSSKLTRPEGVPPDGGVLDPGDSSSTPPPKGPFGPLQGGALQQSPSEGGGLQPLTRGQGALLEQPPSGGPATGEGESSVMPVCQEGLEFNEDLGFCVPTECPESQVLDEASGLCVLEEPQVAEEEQQQSQSEEQDQQQQSSNEGDGSDDSSNGNSNGDN